MTHFFGIADYSAFVIAFIVLLFSLDRATLPS